MSHITLNTTIHEIFHHPQIGDLNPYLIYCLDRDLWLNEHVNAIMDQPLTAAKEINWSPEGILKGMNFLLDELEQDRVRQHFIYSEGNLSAGIPAGKGTSGETGDRSCLGWWIQFGL